MIRSTVTVEHRRPDDLLGLGQAAPRLSWATSTDAPDWLQAAYEVEVSSPGKGDEPWSSGRIDSDESVLVGWPAAPLGSRVRRAVRVRVWGDEGGDASEWSAPVTFETGLLDPADWSARFVTPDGAEDTSTIAPCPHLRREVELHGPPQRARLYVTALGVYEVEINGHRVGDHVLAPGWSSYGQRLRYETFDVTELLRPGRNAIGAVLGDGWYRGTLGWRGGRRRPPSHGRFTLCSSTSRASASVRRSRPASSGPACRTRARKRLRSRWSPTR